MSRPAASFDASYTTYEHRKEVKLPENLLDLRIEDFIMVEVGGWGTNIKLRIKPGAKVNTITNENGTTITLTPPERSKSSIMSQICPGNRKSRKASDIGIILTAIIRG